MLTIGDRIRDRRKELRLSQAQLAELASLNQVTIAKYETGRVEPGAQAITRIADALETTADALLGRTADQVRSAEDEQDEVFALRARLKDDPSFRLLYDTATKARPEHLRAAAMLKSLEESQK
jgi:transcriptional regulator with XRE-family HTH domain